MQDCGVAANTGTDYSEIIVESGTGVDDSGEGVRGGTRGVAEGGRGGGLREEGTAAEMQ